jgi:hypothetical protein
VFTEQTCATSSIRVFNNFGSLIRTARMANLP